MCLGGCMITSKTKLNIFEKYFLHSSSNLHPKNFNRNVDFSLWGNQCIVPPNYSFFLILAHSVLLCGGRRLRLPEHMSWLVVVMVLTLSFLKKATGNEVILHFQFSLSRRKKKKCDFFFRFRNHVVMCWPDLRFFYGGAEKMNPAIAM